MSKVRAHITVSLDGLDPEERATVTAHRWWSAAELEATAEPFVPPELPRLLRQLTNGQSTDGQSAGGHAG